MPQFRLSDPQVDFAIDTTTKLVDGAIDSQGNLYAVAAPQIVRNSLGQPTGALLDPMSGKQISVLGGTVDRLKSTIKGSPGYLSASIPMMATPPNCQIGGASTGIEANTGATLLYGSALFPGIASPAQYSFPNGSGSANTIKTLNAVAYCHNYANWNDTGNVAVMSDSAAFERLSSTQLNCATLVNAAQQILAFQTDAQTFGVLVAVNGVYMFNLNVDGQQAYAAPLPASITGNSARWLMFNFPTRKMRNIIVTGGAVANICGLAVSTTDTVSPYDITKGKFAAAWLSDSYGGILPTSEGFLSFFDQALAMLGCYAVVGQSGPGTGYITASAPCPTFADPTRLSQVLNASPDVLILTGGVNDAAASVATTTALAVASVLSQSRAALPNAVICMTSTQYPPSKKSSSPGYDTAFATMALAALQNIAGPWVFINNSTGSWTNSSGVTGVDAGVEWQVGTGYLTAPTGTGNDDLYVTFDALHPTAALTTTLNGSITLPLAAATVTVASTAGFLPSGTAVIQSGAVFQTFTYTGLTSTTFTGCNSLGSGTVATGNVSVAQGVGVDYWANRLMKSMRDGILAL